MEKYSGKGSERGIMAPKKGYRFSCIDKSAERDQDGQFCNRIGCNGRLKYTQNTKNGSLDKAKQSQTFFPSSNKNEITRNSTRGRPGITSAKKLALDPKRKLPSQFDLSSESGSSVSPPSRSQITCKSESLKRSEFTLTEAESSNSSPNVRPKKTSHDNSGSRNYQNTQPSSNASKNFDQALVKNNGSRYGLRNLKCNLISDAVPPKCSSSESKSTGKNVMKKRSQGSESNLSQTGRKTTAPLTSGVSISVLRHNGSASGEGSSASASVRNRRSVNVNTRMRLSCLQNGRNGSNGVSQTPDNERPFNIGGRISSRQFSPNLSSTGSSSYSLSSGDGDDLYGTIPFAHSSELGFTNLLNHETLHRYNMDGIAEVLLALERIEQNEERTHEQLLALETSLFLGGLNIYDQHRDMRLDIDNMSYEELLALEERMGTVSTALSEDALSSCIKTETYQAMPSELQLSGSDEDKDDIKCSICQEEYDDGDEIGRLVECRHGYHETCINQWLRLKNWCPVCKSSAAPPCSS